MTLECCRYITGSEWVTGGADGSVSLWSSTKKRPMVTLRCVCVGGWGWVGGGGGAPGGRG